jgi:hypothetical protein
LLPGRLTGAGTDFVKALKAAAYAWLVYHACVTARAFPPVLRATTTTLTTCTAFMIDARPAAANIAKVVKDAQPAVEGISWGFNGVRGIVAPLAGALAVGGKVLFGALQRMKRRGAARPRRAR